MGANMDVTKFLEYFRTFGAKNAPFRMCFKDLGLDAVDGVDVFDEEHGLVEALRPAFPMSIMDGRGEEHDSLRWTQTWT